MAYSRKYIVDTSLVDKNKRLRLSNLFVMFQEVAEAHAEILGIGKASTTDVGLKWVITRYMIKFERMPTYGEKIEVFTYPNKNNPYFFFRNFFIKDEKGNIIIKAASVWAIIDAKTNKVVINPFKKTLPEESFDSELPTPEKINEDVDKKFGEYHIQYSDIDLNGHVNNSRYIEMIQNIHNSEYFLNHEFDSLLINYFMELKENDVVTLYSNSSNPEIIKGSTKDKDSFKVIIYYK